MKALQNISASLYDDRRLMNSVLSSWIN